VARYGARDFWGEPGLSILLRPDIGGFDDGLPFFDLGLLKFTERLCCLLGTRGDLITKLAQPILNALVGHGVRRRRVELRYDVFGSRLRDPKAIPDRDVKSRYPSLVYCRDIGRQ
jgi:hypothetical protein